MPLWAGSPPDGSGRLFVMEQVDVFGRSDRLFVIDQEGVFGILDRLYIIEQVDVCSRLQRLFVIERVDIRGNHVSRSNHFRIQPL